MWLRELGAQVSGYALAPEFSGGIFSACKLEGVIDSRIGDIRDRDRLRGAFEQSQPEIVFHLAAQSLVRRSYCEPLATLETNAIGTANVLEAVRHAPSVRAVVVVTSDKCYENPETAHAFRERDRLGGADPYSASKGCAEIVAHAPLVPGKPRTSSRACHCARGQRDRWRRFRRGSHCPRRDPRL